MLKSGQVILPVFYHVKPEDLRWIENGPFKAGFEKHLERKREEEIPKWKDALCKISDFRGFRLDEVNGNEEQLIRSILVEVRRLLPMDVLPGKQRYGMEDSMKDVLKTLDRVSVLGLVGMGGIGKTTLAEEIFNRFILRRQFERYCFLKDVRSSEPSQLQRQLLNDLNSQCELHSISPQEYKRAFDGLICQRVLVIVDDIDHSSQFAALIPDIQKIGSGSRIVITSRQYDVLNHAMAAAACQEVSGVPLLNKIDSRHLFNRHAFFSETPSEGFAELAEKVADACGGHALLLESIGASLFDQKDPEDREIWLEAVKALQENDDIFDKLRTTYNSLPTDGDRAMFRDIACMLIDMEKEVALAIWKSCNSPLHHCTTSKTPALVLRRLMDRSLAKMDFRGRLSMHDVLRDMGRDIVKKEAQRLEESTHLWDAATGAKVLSCRKNTSVRGISLAVREREEDMSDMDYSGLNGEAYLFATAKLATIKDGGLSCEASQLTSMKELHLLMLDGCNVVVPDDFSKWPQELRWLQWRSFCFLSLPSQLKLPYLVVLDLSYSGNLTCLWENDAHIQLPVLQTLILSKCRRLKELAENVDQSLSKLKILLMDGCWSLRRLPDSIGRLLDLERLNLHECEKVVILPDAIVRLVYLKELILRGCSGLKQVPKELGKLTNLETFVVSWTAPLFELPATIGGLKMLKTLKMKSRGVKDLSAEFGLLRSITSLSIIELGSVPQTFQGLKVLTYLNVCKGSSDLGDLGAFTALKVLKLRKHATITFLPKSLDNLKRLVRLKMDKCLKLLFVEALPEGLEHLDLSYCPNLTRISSLAALRFLVYLNLCNCRSLRQLHCLECLTTLEDTNVLGCSLIRGCRNCAMENSALRECYLSGSKVGVVYNNRWLEREPGEQVISCSSDAIAFLPNGMANQLVLREESQTLVMETTISRTAECIALICCLVTSESQKSFMTFFSLKVGVLRGGRLVTESRLVPELHASVRNQIYLCTLRRENLVVQSLQLGDQICVYMESYTESLTVLEGAICVVYNDDENLILTMNSEVLSKSQSEDLVTQFGQLVLEDKHEQLLFMMNLELSGRGQLESSLAKRQRISELPLELKTIIKCTCQNLRYRN